MAVDEMMNPEMDADESLEQLEALVIDIQGKFTSCTDKRSDDED